MEVKARATTKVKESVTTTFGTFKKTALRETAFKKADIIRSTMYTEN